MIDSYYELLWLYMIYSFWGWCGEVILAAVKRHRFVNRGAVSGPLCPVYGLGAVVTAVFLPELRESLFFLFLGGMVLNTFVEYVTGRLLEMSLHKKWWDYSKERFNFGGYICLKSSLGLMLSSYDFVYKSSFGKADCFNPCIMGENNPVCSFWTSGSGLFWKCDCGLGAQKEKRSY